MSDAYERERQNNARLEELSAKVSSLRGVTVDIYDNARAQDVIDNTVCPLGFYPSTINRRNNDDHMEGSMFKANYMAVSPTPSRPCRRN